MKESVEELINKISDAADKETSFQIRIYDDNTGKAFYKYLTISELLKITSVLGIIKWEG